MNEPIKMVGGLVGVLGLLCAVLGGGLFLLGMRRAAAVALSARDLCEDEVDVIAEACEGRAESYPFEDGIQEAV